MSAKNILPVTFVGMRFRENYNCTELKNSNSYKLEAEPNNVHDNNAIKGLYKNVNNEWVHFGYVPRDQNKNINLQNFANTNCNYKLNLKYINSTAIKMEIIY